MISTIYLNFLTVYVPYEEETSFTKFVCQVYGPSIKDHLPEGITFKSIEYKKDSFIQSFLKHSFVGKDYIGIKEMESKGGIVEAGVFIMELEGEESYTHKKLDCVEFVFKALHESYSFIGSMFLYLGEDIIEQFDRLHTYASDEEDEDNKKVDPKYYPLLDSYFYDVDIADEYLDEIAKILLIEDS